MTNKNMESFGGYIQRSEEIIFGKVDDDVVLLSLENEAYYYLNSLGKEIWDRLEEPILVDDLIKRLFELYDVPEHQCHTETIQFLEELSKIGAIKIRDEID
jgi:TfoX/Sxy family transcriptional regulator of competence genes